MVDFTVTITDKTHLAGLTYARTQYNNSLPKVPIKNTNPVEYEPIEDHPDYLATDQDYIQHIMSKACESYAKQAGYNEVEIIAKITELQAKLAHVKRL